MGFGFWGFWGRPFYEIEFGTFRGDLITGSSNRDKIFALSGNDTIDAGDGRDTVFAGLGDDMVDGGAGRDDLFGGFGTDTIIGGLGNDKIDGGHGTDTAVFSGNIADYTITSLGNRTFVSGADGIDTLRKIEVLQFDDLSVFIDGRNNAVVAKDDTATTEENTTLEITASALTTNDFDFDGDTLTVTGVSATSAAGATVTLADGVVTYVPGTLFDSLAAGDTAEDTFSYTVTDNAGSSSTATVTVTITGSNDAPVLAALAPVSIEENTSGVVATAAATDVDGDAITYTLGGDDAAFFSIDAATGEITLDAALDFEAPLDLDGDNVYALEVTASDGDLSDTQALEVTITDVAEGPFRLVQSFETEATGAQYVNAATDGTALPLDAVVDIENVDGLATVDSTAASAGLLGYNAEWVNTRESSGLSDGDFVGVTDFTGTVGSYTDGSQGYQISDADGLYRLTFDAVDLSNQGPITVSLDLFVQDTGYETGDLVRVVVVTDQGTEVLLDAAGDDIEALEGLGTFQTLSVDLGAEVQSAQLIVELDSNASTEAIYVDNVVIEETPVVVPFGFTQSFETEATGAQYVNAATDGTALATGAIVDIENVAGLSTVDSTDASAGLLGFDAEWENTRSGVGLSDGDFVGVTDFTGTVGAFTDGTQGYQLSDADGLMRLRFDQIDTSGQGPVEVALDLFVQSTGWEADDLIRVVVETDQGTEVLLDTTGQDIDDLDIEGAFQTLSVVLGAEVNTAQLIVELDSNSGSEAIYVDNVVVREADPEPQPFAIAQSFEDEATGAQYSNAATDGTVLPADAEVDIENVPGLATVDSTEASAGSLGFNATWINSRGDVGLSDGDFVGVTSFTGTVGSYTDGIQGYQISDPDGLYRLTFDDIDLTAVGAVTVSLDYFLQSTGYESDDLFRVFVITDQGTQTLIDTSGQDIDDLGIEGAWTTLTADIDASVTSAQLVVEFDANSGSEAVYLDNISVATPVEPTGTSVGITADAPSVLEGDSGTTTVTFTVTRSGDVSGATDVDFAVGGDVDAADFGGTLPSGTVSFAADETTQTITVEITGDTTSEIDEALTVTLSNATGDATIATAQATTVVQNDDVEFATIAEIQGSGLSSARVGQTLQTTGIVTYIEPDGFYIQMAVGDGDDATSDGMFVFVGDDVLANNPIVAVGNEVEVIGTVSEFGGLTQLETDINTILIVGNSALPDAVTVEITPDSSQASRYEQVEGMRVEVISGEDDPLVVIENFNLDRFGEISVSAGTQTQPTQLFDPNSEATQVADLAEDNLNNRLVIDDGDFGQNPTEFAFIPNKTAGDDGDGILDAEDDFSLGGTLRLGAEITAPIEGVMSEGFGDYRVLATETMQVDEATNSGARPASPDDVLGNEGGAPQTSGQLIVTSFNVLNYFTTFTGGTGPDGAVGVRGADNANELQRQTDKLVAAILETGSDVLALQELENNGFGSGSAIHQLVAELNAADSGANWQFVNPTDLSDPGEDGFIGTDAITTGIIYDANAVTLIHSDYYVFEEASAAPTFAIADVLNPFAEPSNQVGDFQRNRPAVTATFEENDTKEAFTVTSVHHKSKGDSNLVDVIEDAEAALAQGRVPESEVAAVQQAIDDLRADPNFDQGDGQGFWNQVRTDAADELTVWLDEVYLPAAGVGDNSLILGDFNAYAKEDPTQSTARFDGTDADTDADYVDIIDTFVPGGQADAFSFVFDGQQGTLDQGFASVGLSEHITGATEWHINAQEPDLLNYDDTFNDTRFFNDDVFAASDHDPLIIGLDFNDPLAVV